MEGQLDRRSHFEKTMYELKGFNLVPPLKVKAISLTCLSWRHEIFSFYDSERVDPEAF